MTPMVMDEAASGEEEEGDERNDGERKVGSHGWLMGFKCVRERERWGVKWNFQLKNMSSQQLNH